VKWLRMMMTRLTTIMASQIMIPKRLCCGISANELKQA
jgi:hypothetical protein